VVYAGWTQKQQAADAYFDAAISAGKMSEAELAEMEAAEFTRLALYSKLRYNIGIESSESV
jgi:hypothetical protein